MKTIAEQLEIKDFPFEIKDKQSRIIYLEDENQFWVKFEYNSNGNLTKWQTSKAIIIWKYDSQGNVIKCNDIVVDDYHKDDDTKTIAQQLEITDFPFQIKNKDCNEIYYEDCTGYWTKREYDSDGNKKYFEDSNGYWTKRKYDSDGNEIYFENSNGFWCKREYDSYGNEVYYEDSNKYWYKYEYDLEGNEIYFEDSEGEIIDNRPKDDVTILNGIKYKRIEE